MKSFKLSIIIIQITGGIIYEQTGSDTAFKHADP